jgi:hypothetical protein
MQGYTFVPPSGPPREGQKSEQSMPRRVLRPGANTEADYVFVDEHNRHKRLKGVLSSQISNDEVSEKQS